MFKKKFLFKNQCLKFKRGLTLIEILISLVLFVFISLSMTNIISQTSTAQIQFDRLIEKKRILSNVSQVIRKDLSNSYSWRGPQNFMRSAYREYLAVNNMSDYISSYLPLQDRIYFEILHTAPKTGLYGESDHFYLTSASSFENDGPSVLKIGYFLEDCPAEEASSRCLVRKSSFPAVEGGINSFNNDTLKTTPLLQNIKSFTVSYWNPKNEEWQESFTPPLATGFGLPPLFPPALKLIIEFEELDSLLTLLITVPRAFLSSKIEHSQGLPLGNPTPPPVQQTDGEDKNQGKQNTKSGQKRTS